MYHVHNLSFRMQETDFFISRYKYLGNEKCRKYFSVLSNVARCRNFDELDSSLRNKEKFR